MVDVIVNSVAMVTAVLAVFALVSAARGGDNDA